MLLVGGHAEELCRLRHLPNSKEEQKPLLHPGMFHINSKARDVRQSGEPRPDERQPLELMTQTGAGVLSLFPVNTALRYRGESFHFAPTQM